MKVAQYWKAIVAALAAAAASLSVALEDGVINGAEAWTTAGAVLAALGFTWAVPNKPATPKDEA